MTPAPRPLTRFFCSLIKLSWACWAEMSESSWLSWDGWAEMAALSCTIPKLIVPLCTSNLSKQIEAKFSALIWSLSFSCAHQIFQNKLKQNCPGQGLDKTYRNQVWSGLGPATPTYSTVSPLLPSTQNPPSLTTALHQTKPSQAPLVITRQRDNTTASLRITLQQPNRNPTAIWVSKYMNKSNFRFLRVERCMHNLKFIVPLCA